MARHGENIHKRKDGRWEARIIVGRKQDGKAKYRSVYGKTYEEVKEKKSLYTKRGNRYIQSDLTFSEIAENWIESKRGKVKNSTYNHYSNQYNLHIRPRFYEMKMTDITAEEYDSFLMQLEDDGYSVRTILLLRTIIKMVLKYAESKYGISPMKEIYLPKKPKKQVEAFTRSEQSIIEKYLIDHLDNYALSVMLSMYCGLRIGEVCALQWSDINTLTGVVTVSKTLIRIQSRDTSDSVKTKIIIQKPKTETSSRKVPIPEFLVSILRKSFIGTNMDFYVITGNSHYMEPRVCLRKFKRILTKLGLGEYTFHACRHTYATRCVELGIDPKIISELLGHSSVKTTLDRYVHPSMDFKKDQVNKLTPMNDHK